MNKVQDGVYIAIRVNAQPKINFPAIYLPHLTLCRCAKFDGHGAWDAYFRTLDLIPSIAQGFRFIDR